MFKPTGEGQVKVAIVCLYFPIFIWVCAFTMSYQYLVKAWYLRCPMNSLGLILLHSSTVTFRSFSIAIEMDHLVR